jgi:hypothetical protein
LTAAGIAEPAAAGRFKDDTVAGGHDLTAFGR